MSGPQDDDFDDEDGIEEELERHYEALRGFVYDYIDENDVPDDIMAALLNDLALEMRKVAYVLDTEKPSVGGLKLMLDRTKSDLESAIRRHKKEAEEFMAGMQEAMLEAKDRLEEELEQLEALDPDNDDDDDDAPARGKAAGKPAGKGAKVAAAAGDPEDDDEDDDLDDEEDDSEEDEDSDDEEDTEDDDLDEDEEEDDEDAEDEEDTEDDDSEPDETPEPGPESDEAPKKDKPGKDKTK
ncbi:hypothetical protein CH338_17340 [Rhodoplanes elegans]|uniref:Uncharacterized protein n=1 Tax=Rhodoplanes elegans TaxID=29408 RepID=A0A327KEQ4_9BRAD|nr:hypothetical protein [Rhodoplanes elegans]RAI36611.1 hypothetical protein CH338_17340 [Rhodoplanes elegans]